MKEETKQKISKSKKGRRGRSHRDAKYVPDRVSKLYIAYKAGEHYADLMKNNPQGFFGGDGEEVESHRDRR